MDAREDRLRLFQRLGDSATLAEFFERVADDVVWIVHGPHPIADVYRSKSQVVAATVSGSDVSTRDRVRLRLDSLAVDRTIAVVELIADSTALDAALSSDRLCWVCRFEDGSPDANIVEVHDYR